MDGVTHVPRSRQGTFQLVIPSKDIRTLLSLPLEHSYPQVAIRTINFRLNLILIFHPWRTAFQEDGKTSMSRMLEARGNNSTAFIIQSTNTSNQCLIDGLGTYRSISNIFCTSRQKENFRRFGINHCGDLLSGLFYTLLCHYG